jgi:hypothetical protein
VKALTRCLADLLMFTTRKREMALNRADVELRKMAAGESMQLLTQGMPEASDHHEALAAFIEELGGWALHARCPVLHSDLFPEGWSTRG